MRVILLFVVISTLAAADPMPQPYPSGPLLTIAVPDVARLRAHLAASWYGTLWASPSADQARRRMTELIAESEALTGIAWSELAARATRIDLNLGEQTIVQVASSDPVAPLLAGVDAAIAADTRRVADYWSAARTWQNRMFERMRDTEDIAADQHPTLLPVLPVERTSMGLVIGRARSTNRNWLRSLGWLLRHDERTVTLHHPATEPAQALVPLADDHDLSFAFDLAAYADGSGIPGLGQALRLSGATRALGSIDLSSKRSSETVTVTGAKLPLKAVDTVVLAAEVPAHALALSALGIDGAALAALIARVAAEEPGLSPLSDVATAAVRGLDGTAWFAAMPGAPYPDLVLAVPATDAVDAWLAQTLPDEAALLANARQQAVEIDAHRGFPITLAIRRTPRAWLIGTDVKALEKLGNPGLDQRLARDHGIPAGAVALSAQANPLILARLSGYALAAQLWLATQSASDEAPPAIRVGNDSDTRRFTKRQLADLRLAITAVQSISANTKVPTTVGYAQVDAGGVTLRGRDLTIGLAVVPLVLVAACDLAPMLVPDWALSQHPLLASAAQAGGWPWSDPHAQGGSWWQREERVFALAAQQRALALRALNAVVRGEALRGLARRIDDDRKMAADLEWWTRGVRDERSAARAGALAALGVLRNRPGAAPLITAAFTHADPLTRAAAYEAIGSSAQWKRTQQRQKAKHPNFTVEPIDLPPVLDDLLAADARERDPVAAVHLMQAIAGWDDPRAIAALVRRLQDPAPRVALQAAYELTLPSIGAPHHQAVLATVARLLEDPTPSELFPTVGRHAREVLYQDIKGPDADALIARDLDRPDPPPTADNYLELSPRIHAICVLLQRDHAPAVRLADAALTTQPTDPTTIWPLLYALGQSTLPAAESILVRVLSDPATPGTPRFQAVWSLEMTGFKRPLGAAAITALTATCLTDVGAARSRARRCLDRQKLTPEQTKAFTNAVQQATTRFGDKAFPNYRPPKPPPPPPPPPVKTGADDF